MNRINPKTVSRNSGSHSPEPKGSKSRDLQLSVAIAGARRAAAGRGLPDDLATEMANCVVKMGVDFVIDLAKLLPIHDAEALHQKLFKGECTALADAYVKAATEGKTGEKQEIMETIRALRRDSPEKISFLRARLEDVSRALPKASRNRKEDLVRPDDLLGELSVQQKKLERVPQLPAAIASAFDAEVISGFDWNTGELTINEEKMRTLLRKGECPEFLLRLVDGLLVFHVRQARALWRVVKDCLNDSTKKKFDTVREAIECSLRGAIEGQGLELRIDPQLEKENLERFAFLAEVQQSRFEPKSNNCLVC